ncbi:hypothetical protein V496_05375 [Pseudogymnoascus sp. VKM F-4515 (FW-2607)]|nr:hypothetical protein V496_05375 [Pseudogymnoascus sp. VKM F-4515 (FW-2607)]
MEVDQQHFWHELLPILKAISTASFVTVDVEMSGISTKSRYSPAGRFNETGKPSLQQQYEDTKEAAERYQVLQIGLTCVEEDWKNGVYTARPYNFNINPLLEDGDKLDIYRDITLSSSSMHFLRKNCFDIGAVFTKGISYISRKEQTQARQAFLDRQNRNSTIPDLEISPGDQATLTFYRNARKQLLEWTDPKNKDVRDAMGFYNVAVPGGLSGYQRRLVYQLVRTEFKEYRAFLPRKNADFVQVEKMDVAKEAKIAASKVIANEAQLAKQIGFRYIFEALAGGDLSSIAPTWFCVNSDGQSAFIDTSLKKLELSSLSKALTAKSRVLVGHNLFTDLIFLYRTFIGDLPPTVTEFQEKIHALFPMVIDTKYMATREALVDSRQSSSLQDLHQDLKSQRTPQICLPEEFRSYQNRHLLHEAGYDSYLTAQIFLKLAAKLDGGRPNRSDVTHAVDSLRASTGSTGSTSSDEDGGVLLDLPLNAPRSANRFQVLSEASPVKKKARQASLLDSDIEDDMTGSPPLGQDGAVNMLADATCGNDFVPPLTAPFWRVYANKLRVYGTLDEVCELDGGGAGGLAFAD